MINIIGSTGVKDVVVTVSCADSVVVDGVNEAMSTVQEPALNVVVIVVPGV
jgi:hypothetical protein